MSFRYGHLLCGWIAGHESEYMETLPEQEVTDVVTQLVRRFTGEFWRIKNAKRDLIWNWVVYYYILALISEPFFILSIVWWKSLPNISCVALRGCLSSRTAQSYITIYSFSYQDPSVCLDLMFVFRESFHHSTEDPALPMVPEPLDKWILQLLGNGLLTAGLGEHDGASAIQCIESQSMCM